MKFVFSEEAEKKIVKILNKYPEDRKKSALLPLLELAQRQEGYIPPEAMEDIAKRLDLSPAYVQSVSSFYTMFHAKPVGKYVILFCKNISCYLNGSDSLLDYTAQKLGIQVGETTEDKKFTLLKEECLADCCSAPMMRVNDTYHGNLTKEKIDMILDSMD
ncbi:MAG: NADH-quinone oxidoreductase subunit NuoE [Nitrospinales bacterium]